MTTNRELIKDPTIKKKLRSPLRRYLKMVPNDILRKSSKKNIKVQDCRYSEL